MKKTQGFTLVEIMIVVAIIGILAAIAVPNFVKNRNDSQRRACISNMRQIDTACQNWVAAESTESDFDLENIAGDAWKDTLCGQGKYIQSAPKCPTAGADYEVTATDTDTIKVACTDSKASDNKHELDYGE